MRDSVAATLSLVYLARLREAFGAASERDRAAAWRDHGRRACASGSRRAAARGRSSSRPGRAVRVAVNHDLADPDTPVRPGDEVALFPPVTGG